MNMFISTNLRLQNSSITFRYHKNFVTKLLVFVAHKKCLLVVFSQQNKRIKSCDWYFEEDLL